MACCVPRTDPTPCRESALLTAINALRAANALPPLAAAADLADAARAHSCDMAQNSFIDHTGSDGRTLTERVPPHDPPYTWPSENIAAGTDDPAEVLRLWMDEPPDGWHRRNLLNPDHTQIGVGYCAREEDPTGNKFYWTIDLARFAP